MKVIVNEEDVEVDDGTTVAALLERLERRARNGHADTDAHLPQLLRRDDRPGAPHEHRDDREEGELRAMMLLELLSRPQRHLSSLR